MINFSKRTPLVSVVKRVYNGSQYLVETNPSILNQMFVDFEFVVVDDCSTDQSVETIHSFYRQFHQDKAVGREPWI